MALAKWCKIDFHAHSPASNCFKDKNITARQWVDAAKQAGLNAVVLTDHNSVGFIKEIDALHLQETDGIKVFYGIELCVSADLSHFIVIFDDKMTVQQIEDAVIADLNLRRESWGDTTIFVSEDRLRTLCENQKGHIFVIPAHFASEKGLGKSNINAIKAYKSFVRFDAIEVRNDNDVQKYENLVRAGVIEKTPLITGSDNPSKRDQTTHSIEGFGTAFTWIKTSCLTFDGLRQVFLDPENRCINMLALQDVGVDYNPNEVTYNYISGIKINGLSHISDLNMRFSPGLNCIIGGRGTGKSTVVDAIKYGLNSGQDISKCTLLDKTMLQDGSITTYFNFGYENEYKITASRSKKQLYFVYEDKNGVQDNPPEFKIDFYGQKEIYEMLEEEKKETIDEPSPLIYMIDERIKDQLYTYKDKINEIIAELLSCSSAYMNHCKRIAEMPSLKAEVEKAEAMLKRFKASGIEEKREKYKLLNGWIKTTQSNLFSYAERLEKTKDSYIERRNEYGLTLAKLKDESETNKDNILVIDELLKSCDRVIDELTKEEKIIEIVRKKYEQSEIHRELEKLHSDYMHALESIKGAGSEEIQLVQEGLQRNQERINEISKSTKEKEEVTKHIIELIDSLIENKKNLTNLRTNYISEMNLTTIKFNITSMSNAMRFKAGLQKEFNRDTFDDDFTKLAEALLNPSNNHEMLKKFYLFILTSKTGDLNELGVEGLSARFNSNWIEKCKNMTLSSLINVLPEDKVNISIEENGHETDINDGSPGQKCAALLAFILNGGDNPLIIDQPEDDLDNSLIYNLIVKSIRKIKTKRQIIIVTHNPNIPVLGDAEGIIVLERDNNGKVSFRKNKKAGCIEETEIRKGICEIMEGGEEAFRKREAKYLANG